MQRLAVEQRKLLGDDRRPALERHGFATPVESMHFYVREVAEPPELPALPDGFHRHATLTRYER